MRTRRRYILLYDVSGSSDFREFFDYIKYSTCDYVMVDAEACIIDSYLDPNELGNEFYNLPSTPKFFIAEMTGEAVWRNPYCGFDKVKNFFR